jgi:hypothetical protein
MEWLVRACSDGETVKERTTGIILTGRHRDEEICLEFG